MIKISGFFSKLLSLYKVKLNLICILQTTTRPQINTCRELIKDRLQIKWEIQDDQVIIELFGRMAEDQYMAFGISGAQGKSQMVN